MRYSFIFTILALLFYLYGCGESAESTESAETSQKTAMLVNDTTKLPTCYGGGELYYVYSEKQFYVCTLDGWEVIDLSGKDGIDGENGTDGNDGRDGSNGIDGSDGTATAGLDVESQWLCDYGEENLDINPDRESKGWGAQILKYSNGAYEISCSSYSYYYPAGVVDSSNTMYYHQNSIAVDKGVVGCVTWIVSSEFLIDSETLIYSSNGDPTLYEEVQCKRTF